MTSILNPDLRAGLQAFTSWLGRLDLIADLEQQVARNDRLKNQYVQIAGKLLSPPDENVRSPVETWIQTPVDKLHRELAVDLDLKPRPFWPDGASYAVCLTHDVDRIRQTYQQVVAGYRATGPYGAFQALGSWPSRQQDPFFNFDRIRQYETEWGVHSAIYPLFEKRRWGRALLKGEIQHVLGVYDPFEIGEQLCQLQADGWEIGLHGSFNAHRSRTALTDEITKLQQLLKLPDAAFGIRNHYLQFDWRVTPSIQLACHALYDSTIGFNFTYGFRCGTTFPFVIPDPHGNGLIEMPLSVMDTALKFAVPGREFEVADRIADEVRHQGGLLMINWHQHFCNRDTNPLMFNWVEKIITRAHTDKAWIALPRDVALHWHRRIIS